MVFKIAKALGLNSDQQAALVLASPPDGENIFLAVLKLTSDDAFTRGRQLLSELSDLYFEPNGNGVGERLTGVFQEGQQKLQDTTNFSLLLGAVVGKVLYLIGQGEIVAYLRRIDHLSLLFQHSSGQLVSGFLQEGDRILLSTQSFTLFLGEELKNSLELPILQWEEEVANKINLGSPEELAAIVLDVEGEEQILIPHTAEEAEEKKVLPRLTLSLSDLSLLIKRFFPKSSRAKLIVALVLIAILAAGTGLKYQSSKNEEVNRQFNEAMQRASDDFAAAQGLADVNPADAGQKLGSAKENLKKALSLKPNDQKANALQAQIEGSQGSVSQKYENTKFDLYLDLNLIKNGFKADYVSLSAGKLLLLNSNDQTLVLIDKDKKNHQILAGKEKLGEAKFATLNGNLAFIYSVDKGVLVVNVDSKTASAAAKLDKDWGEVVDLYGFAGNIYLLDAKGNQIWKYLPITGGYSDKREYLQKEVKANLAGAKRMQIESSIYVLKIGGEILRFTKGTADFFSIGGLDKGIKDPKGFFTSSEVDNLYVLDSGNSRLLVLTKVGAYKQQYLGDKFATVLDLVVDEKIKKVYLLDGNKIFTMDLK
ncbi:hypothetical protein HY386_01555 [Candidatus Daviesbacteria bacterium]|nr:hypothetical protein [Candidatus Daviesbacteria bacterium]